MVLDAGGMRRLGTVSVSAASLWHRGLEMLLDDGGGIGWTLVGSVMIGSDRVTFECPAHDPDFPACVINASEESRLSIADVLAHVGLTREDGLDAQG